MMTRRMGAAILAALMTAGQAVQAQVSAADVAERWHQVVAAMEPAAFVSVRLHGGERMKGTVIAAGPRSFTLVPRTRIPVAPREIGYDEVASLERARPGMSPGLKVLIGAGAGVGGFLLLMITALALSGD